jgi:hypothetical protein
MKQFAKYRVLLWLALLFSCGAVFGYYVSTRLTPPNGQNSSQGRALESTWRARRIESLRRALDLTDEQLRDMSPAFDRAEDSLRRLREETATRAREIVKANGKELMPLLTLEQQERFKRWVAEQARSLAPISPGQSPSQKDTTR